MSSSSFWCESFHFLGDSYSIFELFKNEPRVFFLDSSSTARSTGRYSFIGFDPFEVFSSRDPKALEQLEKKARPYLNQKMSSPLPFPAGLVGYLSYDLGLLWENIEYRRKDDIHLPHAVFGFYDTILTIDHVQNKIFISATGWPETTQVLKKKRAQERIHYICKKLSELKPSRYFVSVSHSPSPKILLKSNFTLPAYKKAVQQILDYIRRGDIYQVNLAQRFMLDTKSLRQGLHPAALYHSLREKSPSSFSGYFDAGSMQIMSSSPERFVKVKDRLVQTRPMKGTRPRGTTVEQDRQYRRELEQSAKDIAELLMITDLERNDLGRVCAFGSVKVKNMRTIEEYQTVFQATSTIEGTLGRDKNIFDVLRACFPGGSITGCPKIRAMEIIEELEPHHRGLYTGILGYISPTGVADFNILIRTMFMHQKKIYFHVGGGIVADSKPEKEYQETLVKAKAMQECLREIVQTQVVKTTRYI